MDNLIADIRQAAVQQDANHRIKAVLKDWLETLASDEAIKNNIPDYDEDEHLLFEDDNVAIWHCRYRPGFSVPAHDHQIVATIAVYDGVENNTMWVKTPEGGLKKQSEIPVKAGEVLQFGATAIHSVNCVSDEDSLAVHVYQGNLTKTERSLYDTKTGTALPFSDENYQKLVSQG